MVFSRFALLSQEADLILAAVYDVARRGCFAYASSFLPCISLYSQEVGKLVAVIGDEVSF